MTIDESLLYKEVLDLFVERGLSLKQAYYVLSRTEREIRAFSNGFERTAIGPKLEDVLKAEPVRSDKYVWDDV